MVRKLLVWMNYALFGCAIVLLLSIAANLFKGGREAAELDTSKLSVEIAKNSFLQTQQAYNSIGDPVLRTSLFQPTLELPDLRPYLTYYGKNARPDIGEAAQYLYFGLKGAPAAGFPEKTKIFLRYDASKKPGTFIFSPENQPTHLWLQVTQENNRAKIEVEMKNEKGQFITEPPSRATFTLPVRDFARTAGSAWEIGKWKVDATLLARQRARWFGQDQFLNEHGGEEYSDLKGSERVEFGEANERYALFLKEGDCFIWDGQRWQPVKIGEASQGFALLCVHKIDERFMRFNLWDANGQGHVVLNLVKSKEAWTPKSYEQDFKFISSRTLSQYVFEVKKNRMVLRPYDWLLLKEGKWSTLATAEEIDAFVERKNSGVLFIFSGPTQQEDKQVLRATLYSPSRTETSPISFPLDQPSILGTPVVEEPKEERSKSPLAQRDEPTQSPKEIGEARQEIRLLLKDNNR